MIFFLVGVIAIINITLIAPMFEKEFDSIDSQANSRVRLFEDLIGVSEVDLTVGFKDLGIDLYGRCEYLADEVKINKVYWEDFTGVEKTELIFHELGHCLCYRGHNDATMIDGCPTGFMSEKDVHPKCVKKHWRKYVKEMRENC